MQRLKTRPQFQAALAGRIVSRTTHFALHRIALDAANQWTDNADSTGSVQPGSCAETSQKALLFPVRDSWLGAMAPKRWARRAVTRNAIKRQIYQIGGFLTTQLPQAAHVVRLRATFDRKLFISASSDALRLAVRLELLQLFGKASGAQVASTAKPKAPQ